METAADKFRGTIDMIVLNAGISMGVEFEVCCWPLLFPHTLRITNTTGFVAWLLLLDEWHDEIQGRSIDRIESNLIRLTSNILFHVKLHTHYNSLLHRCVVFSGSRGSVHLQTIDGS